MQTSYVHIIIDMYFNSPAIKPETQFITLNITAQKLELKNKNGPRFVIYIEK